MLQSSPFPPIETFATFQFVATPVCTSSIALLLIKMWKIYSFADVAWEVVLSLKQITKESFLKMNVHNSKCSFSKGPTVLSWKIYTRMRCFLLAISLGLCQMLTDRAGVRVWLCNCIIKLFVTWKAEPVNELLSCQREVCSMITALQRCMLPIFDTSSRFKQGLKSAPTARKGATRCYFVTGKPDCP